MLDYLELFPQESLVEDNPLIRCRVAACPRPNRTGWIFYLVNGGDEPLEQAVLYEVGYEWGDFSNSQEVDERVSNLAPGQHVLVWRENDNVELRMYLLFRMRLQGREARVEFEFPRLYKLTDERLKQIEGLDKRGYEVAVETRASRPA